MLFSYFFPIALCVVFANKAHHKIQATLKTQIKRYADKLYMGSTDWEIAEHLQDYYAGK